MLKKLLIALIGLSVLVAGCGPVGDHAEEQYETRQLLVLDGDDHRGGPHTGLKGMHYRPLNQEGLTDERHFRGFHEGAVTEQQRHTRFGNDNFVGTRLPRTYNKHQPFGFMHHTANDPDVIVRGYGSQSYIDRQLLSDTVASVIVGLPGVHSAAVLITDDECIIGYSGNDDNGDLQEDVELSGLSLTPRWFDVYSTTDQEIIQQMQKAAQTVTETLDLRLFNEEVNDIIDQLGGPRDAEDAREYRERVRGMFGDDAGHEQRLNDRGDNLLNRTEQRGRTTDPDSIPRRGVNRS